MTSNWSCAACCCRSASKQDWDGPMHCSTPGLPVPQYLPEFAQVHGHWVGDAIQPSQPLSSPSPPAFNLPQRQGLFQRVYSSHRVDKVLELQLQHQSFQWIFRVDCLRMDWFDLLVVQGTLKSLLIMLLVNGYLGAVTVSIKYKLIQTLCFMNTQYTSTTTAVI